MNAGRARWLQPQQYLSPAAPAGCSAPPAERAVLEDLADPMQPVFLIAAVR